MGLWEEEEEKNSGNSKKLSKTFRARLCGENSVLHYRGHLEMEALLRNPLVAHAGME